MTLEEFATLLSRLEIPARYRSFKKGVAPNPPYVVYYQSNEENLNADNQAHYTVKSVTVELITTQKQVDLEEKLKELFNQNKLFFEFVDEMELETEGLYQTIYDVTLL